MDCRCPSIPPSWFIKGLITHHPSSYKYSFTFTFHVVAGENKGNKTIQYLSSHKKYQRVPSFCAIILWWCLSYHVAPLLSIVPSSYRIIPYMLFLGVIPVMFISPNIGSDNGVNSGYDSLGKETGDIWLRLWGYWIRLISYLLYYHTTILDIFPTDELNTFWMSTPFMSILVFPYYPLFWSIPLSIILSFILIVPTDLERSY